MTTHHNQQNLKHTIFNELSTARNPNNMIILTAIFQHSGDSAAETLAEIFQDVLLKEVVSPLSLTLLLAVSGQPFRAALPTWSVFYNVSV